MSSRVLRLPGPYAVINGLLFHVTQTVDGMAYAACFLVNMPWFNVVRNLQLVTSS